MPRPLSGIKVLDFTTLLPGPYATQLLADMGAEVLRVEAPMRPDLIRAMQPQISNTDNGSTSAAHATLNRNKLSIALDLKREQAKDIIYTLIADYDIIVEQFRPGVMQRLGLGYNDLAAINPALIYCSITGYGQTGPLCDRTGHDINYLALSGLASFSGRKETGPVLSGTQIADLAGGSHHAVMGIQAAVIQRFATGKGQHIDISMSDATLALTTIFGANYLAGGKTPGLSTEILNGGIFYGYYQTSDGRYFSVGSIEPQFVQLLFAAIDKPEWLERAKDISPEAQTQLTQDIAEVFATKSFVQWQTCFAKYNACIEPVLTLDEVKQHPHFHERNMFVEVPHGSGVSLTQIGSPLKFSASAPEYRHTGSNQGADTSRILLKYGFSKKDITQLRKEKIIF